MPEKYTVKLTRQAEEQLREIVDYIRFTLQAPNTASKMLDALAEEIYSLDQFPYRAPLRICWYPYAFFSFYFRAEKDGGRIHRD